MVGYIILLLLILCGGWFFYRNIESFQTNTYLSAEETMKIVEADSDGYVSNMSSSDLYARKVKSHQEYINKCVSTCLDFDERIKKLLDNAVEKADKFFKSLENEYIDRELMSQIDWKFALTTNEESFPHTRLDVIFLSPKVSTLSEKQLVSLIIHEKVHVYQRKYEHLFQEQLFKNGYAVVKERKDYPLVRANPDIDKYVYTSPTGEQMITLYNSSKPTSIVDVSSDGKKEHPFEEIAYKIGAMYKE